MGGGEGWALILGKLLLFALSSFVKKGKHDLSCSMSVCDRIAIKQHTEHLTSQKSREDFNNDTMCPAL